MRLKDVLTGAAFVVCVTTSGLAHAFTYESQINQSNAAALREQDPTAALKNGTKIGNSNLSLQFSGSGGTSGGGYDSRMVPSGNSAFADPNSNPNFMDHALADRRWPY